MEQTEGKSSQYGVLKLQPQSPLETSGVQTGPGGHFSFSNPVYEPSAAVGAGTTYKVEDVVVTIRGEAATTYRRPSSNIAWSSLHSKFILPNYNITTFYESTANLEKNKYFYIK